MSISHIPKGFTSITPYLIVEDTKVFTKFVVEAFGAEIVDEHIENGVYRHSAIRIFGSMIEVSDGNDKYLHRPIMIHLYVPDCDEVCAKAIAGGGKSLQDVEDMPYGERSGGVEDPSGNSWWIATQQVDMYPNA